MPKKIARSAIRQKKIRSEQVRNAQRRRRERLKAENLGFLQLILPETLRAKLMSSAERSGKTLQEMALGILAKSMGEPEPVIVAQRRMPKKDVLAEEIQPEADVIHSHRVIDESNLNSLQSTSLESETEIPLDDMSEKGSSIDPIETPLAHADDMESYSPEEPIRDPDDKSSSSNQLELF